MTDLALAFSRAALVGESLRPARTSAVPLAVPEPVTGQASPWLVNVLMWTVMVLMIAPEGFDYSNLEDTFAPASGGPLSRAMWLFLLAGGGAVVASRLRLSATVLRWVNPFLLLFVLLATASLFWSIHPHITLRRLFRVLVITLVALSFVLRSWHPARFGHVMRPIVTTVLVASLLFGVVMPEHAIHQESTGVLAGAWHGLSSHKNGLGDLAGIGMILCLHAWLTREAPWPRVVLGLLVAAACLLLSRSATSMVAALFAQMFMVLLLWMPRSLQRYVPWLVGLFLLGLLAYSVAILQIVPGSGTLLRPLSAITGKDMTFTGRTMIWQIMAMHVLQHPWLGTGYGAYWIFPVPGTLTFDYMRRLHFYPGSAHNGYLDIMNDLGIVGALVLIGFLAFFVWQGLKLMRTNRALASLYLALFLHQAIANLSESRWLSAFSVDFVIMTVATLCLGRTLLHEHRRGAIAAAMHRVPPGRVPVASGAPP